MSQHGYEPWQRPDEGYATTPAGQSVYPDTPYGYAPQTPSHSGLGIASFCLGLVTVLLVAVQFVGVIMLVMRSGGNFDPNAIRPEDPVAILTGCSGMLALLTALVGLGLGIAALFRPMTKRWPAITGVVVNGVWLFFLAASTLLSLVVPV